MAEAKKAGGSVTYHLSQQAVKDGERWFPDKAHSLVHHTLGLCGEAGELANIVKKLDRGSLDLKNASVRHELFMEITDVYEYLLMIAGITGLDLERSHEYVRAENEKRFGNANQR